jgi:hypothetical protein
VLTSFVNSFSAFEAPRDYGFLNWDLVHSLPDFQSRNEALVKLKNETLFTPVRPYSGNTAYKQEEHDALHSKLKNSNTSFPHSFVAQPVHITPGDYNSEMVAYVGGGFAWDFALRNLLPVGVDGIIVELQNSCNQSFTYEIEGPDAYFSGDGELHEPKYNGMKVVRSLSFETHPDFKKTPGHCYYYMVSASFSCHLHDVLRSTI